MCVVERERVCVYVVERKKERERERVVVEGVFWLTCVVERERQCSGEGDCVCSNRECV